MRKLLSAALAVFSLTFAAPAAAQVTLVTDPSTARLLGANGVNVGGSIYNVEFVDGNCVQVFGACDSAHFNFTTSAAAGLAAQALIDQVFIGAFGLIDDDPSRTFGCTDLNACNIYIPYALSVISPSTRVSVSAAQNFSFGYTFPDRAFAVGGDAFISQSTADLAAGVYGRFTLAPSVQAAVPEPATWAMMLMGFGAIGFSMRRQRKAGLLTQAA